MICLYNWIDLDIQYIGLSLYSLICVVSSFLYRDSIAIQIMAMPTPPMNYHQLCVSLSPNCFIIMNRINPWTDAID